MNDIETTDEPTSRNVLAKQGVAAVAEIAGGLLLLIMHVFLGRLRPFGMVLGLVIGSIGFGSLLSKDREAKKPGIILAVAGILELLFQFGNAPIKAFSGFLFILLCFGLLTLGVFNGIKFFKGLNSRR